MEGKYYNKVEQKRLQFRPRGLLNINLNYFLFSVLSEEIASSTKKNKKLTSKKGYFLIFCFNIKTFIT